MIFLISLYLVGGIWQHEESSEEGLRTGRGMLECVSTHHGVAHQSTVAKVTRLLFSSTQTIITCKEWSGGWGGVAMAIAVCLSMDAGLSKL